MAIPVGERDVVRVLRPWLGMLFLSSTPTAALVAASARDYAPYRLTLEELRDRVESCLLTSINRYSGGSMRLVTDDYRTVRLTLQDIARMTDDVMGLVFACLTPISVNFEKLNDYSLHVASLAAMRTLYQKYQSFFSVEEYAFLAHMIRTLYRPSDYESWLVPPEGYFTE